MKKRILSLLLSLVVLMTSITIVLPIHATEPDQVVSGTTWNLPVDFSDVKSGCFTLFALDPATGTLLDVTWTDECVNYLGKPADYKWEVMCGSTLVLYCDADGTLRYPGRVTYFPVIEFTAPEAGTYSFAEQIVKDWGPDSGKPATDRNEVFSVSKGNEFTVYDVTSLSMTGAIGENILTEKIGSRRNQTIDLSGSVELAAGEKIYFVRSLAPDCTLADSLSGMIKSLSVTYSEAEDPDPDPDPTPDPDPDEPFEEIPTEKGTKWDLPANFTSTTSGYFKLWGLDATTGKLAELTWTDDCVNYLGKPADYKWEVMCGSNLVLYCDADGTLRYPGRVTYFPVIEFTAPATGIYSFAEQIVKDWGPDSGKLATDRNEIFSVSKGNKFTVYDVAPLSINGAIGENILTQKIGSQRNQTIDLSGSVELAAGEKIYFVRSLALNCTLADSLSGMIKSLSVTYGEGKGDSTAVSVGEKFELPKTFDIIGKGKNLAINDSWSLRAYDSMATRTLLAMTAPASSGGTLGVDVATMNFSNNPYVTFNADAGAYKMAVNPYKSAAVVVFTAPAGGVYYFEQTVHQDQIKLTNGKYQCAVMYTVHKGNNVYASFYANNATVKDGKLTGQVILKPGEELIFAAEDIFAGQTWDIPDADKSAVESSGYGAFIKNIVITKVSRIPEDHKDIVYNASFNGSSDTNNNFTLVGFDYATKTPITADGIVKNGNNWSMSIGTQVIWSGTSGYVSKTVVGSTVGALLFKAPTTGYYSFEMEGVQALLSSSANAAADGECGYCCFEIIDKNGKVLNTASTYYGVEGSDMRNVKLIVSANCYLEEDEEIYLVYRPTDSTKTAAYIVTLSGASAHLGEHGCIGGTSDCKTKAKCEVCGKEYGDYNYNKHVSGCKVVYTKSTADGHFGKWSKCGYENGEAVAHTWSNGKCSACSYKCKHPENASEANCSHATVCAVCGAEHGAKNTNIHVEYGYEINFSAATESKHFIRYNCCMDEYIAVDHEFVNGVCAICEYGSNTHSGGTTPGGTTDPGETNPGTTDPDETKPSTTDPAETTDEGGNDAGKSHGSAIILVAWVMGVAAVISVVAAAIVTKRRK